ncbi:MAG: glycoside hydrolase family 3 protein, partial [Blautia sp.]|nr:glycoside hydrolase family 3 protein [Blautia sp.]
MERKWHEEQRDGYVLIVNEGGTDIAYSPESGIRIIEEDGYAFKDLNGSGKLEPYKDWRLSAEERSLDLASRLSVEQIAGLMLYSKHQTVTPPDPKDTFNLRFAGTYDGKPFDPATGDISQASDQQKEFLEKDKLRHILLTTVESAEVAAKWNNNIQAFCEGTDFGIPASISSDPRHGASSNGEFTVGAAGMISQWPSELGIAASFDPGEAKEFGRIMAKEYRGLGIITALSPQIDLATEPRWNRYNGTWGESVKLNIEMTRAYIDGCQTTEDSETGWGKDSVNAMAKHWPGGGTGEAGRDAHFSYGKYAVYPGKNMEEHLKPFTEGAFRLKGKTAAASSVMPYYTISYGYDTKYGENVGNGFSKYIIGDLLRDKYGFDGVVCTDWGIVDNCQSDYIISGMDWGCQHMTTPEKCYKALMAGVDQFGG